MPDARCVSVGVSVAELVGEAVCDWLGVAVALGDADTLDEEDDDAVPLLLGETLCESDCDGDGVSVCDAEAEELRVPEELRLDD